MGTGLNCLGEVFLMYTHNQCFEPKYKKFSPKMLKKSLYIASFRNVYIKRKAIYSMLILIHSKMLYIICFALINTISGMTN